MTIVFNTIEVIGSMVKLRVEYTPGNPLIEGGKGGEKWVIYRDKVTIAELHLAISPVRMFATVPLVHVYTPAEVIKTVGIRREDYENIVNYLQSLIKEYMHRLWHIWVPITFEGDVPDEEYSKLRGMIRDATGVEPRA